MGFYQKMSELAAETARQRFTFERDCTAFVEWLHKSIFKAFEDWPQERLRLADLPLIPPRGARPGLNGYTDDEGFHFTFVAEPPNGGAIRVDLTITPVLVGLKHVVKAGAETFEIMLGEHEPSGLIAYIRDRIREGVKAAS